MPSVTNLVPASGATGVSQVAQVSFTILGANDPNLVDVLVNGVAAITNGVFETGFSGSITPSSTDMDVVVDHDTPFPAGTAIGIQVFVDAFAYANDGGLSIQSLVDVVELVPYTTLSTQAHATISMWFSTTATGVRTTMFEASTALGVDPVLQIRTDTSNRILVTIGASTWSSPTNTIDPDTFYHLVVLFDGIVVGDLNRLRVRLNDTDITSTGAYSAAVPSTIPTMGYARVGGVLLGTQSETSVIDELAIWRTTLTPAQSTILYDTAHALDLAEFDVFPDDWYAFNNSYENMGTRAGPNAVPVTEAYDNVASMRTTEDGVLLVEPWETLNGEASFTFSFLFRQETNGVARAVAITDDEDVFSIRTTTSNQLVIRIGDSGSNIRVWTSAVGLLAPAATWYRITIVKSGATIRFEVNATDVTATGTTSGTIPSVMGTVSSLTLGPSGGVAVNNMWLDDLAVWDEALSTELTRALGRNVNTSDLMAIRSPFPQPRDWYNFNEALDVFIYIDASGDPYVDADDAVYIRVD